MQKISQKLTQFLEDNIQLIEQQTKNSFDTVYSLFHEDAFLISEFTELMLSLDIDPAEIMHRIPDGYLYQTQRTHYDIPSTVESIGICAFENSALLDIVIPPNCKEIKANAFYRCASLKTCIMSDSVQTIRERAFCVCNNLTDFQLPRSLTVLNQIVSNTNISELVIPKSVKLIKSEAFHSTYNSTIYYEGTVADWERIDKEPRWYVDVDPYIDQDVSVIVCSDGHILAR